jgi:hypothetical protein
LLDRRPVQEKRAIVRRVGFHAAPVVGRYVHASRARWLVLFAALLAFSWQSMVAATHLHSPSESTSRTVIVKQSAHGQPAQRRAPTDSPETCPICRDLAHANYFLPPAPIVIDAPRPVVSLALSATSVTLALPQRSHRWRSRAPPLLLQA